MLAARELLLTMPRTEPALVAFGSRLEVIRRRFGRATDRSRLSMSDFAAELGVTAARYRRYERGEAQMPYAVLAELRRLTGASLDWLIADMTPGQDPTTETSNRSTVGQRLRWARETQEPSADTCAAFMRIAAADWVRYERDDLSLPLEVAREFAHRFSVTLDYLYDGRLIGVAPVVEQALVDKHPQLLAEDARSSMGSSRKNMAMHADSIAGAAAGTQSSVPANRPARSG